MADMTMDNNEMRDEPEVKNALRLDE